MPWPHAVRQCMMSENSFVGALLVLIFNIKSQTDSGTGEHWHVPSPIISMIGCVCMPNGLVASLDVFQGLV